MANQLPAEYDGVTMFTRYLDRQLVESGCIHLEPGWALTRRSDTNMYASFDKEQTWPGILTVGAEALGGWKFFLIAAPEDNWVFDRDLYSEVNRIWLAAARAQLYRAMEVCIEKDPLGNPKLREAFVDQFKLFTAMALAATALLSRYLHLIHPHNTPSNLRRLMEATKNWEADLAGGIVPDYPHQASAAATLKAGIMPYPASRGAWMRSPGQRPP
eukprot:jgi/Tetstr1/442434/TSEL_030558.t1